MRSAFCRRASRSAQRSSLPAAGWPAFCRRAVAQGAHLMRQLLRAAAHGLRLVAAEMKFGPAARENEPQPRQSSASRYCRIGTAEKSFGRSPSSSMVGARLFVSTENTSASSSCSRRARCASSSRSSRGLASPSARKHTSRHSRGDTPENRPSSHLSSVAAVTGPESSCARCSGVVSNRTGCRAQRQAVKHARLHLARLAHGGIHAAHAVEDVPVGADEDDVRLAAKHFNNELLFDRRAELIAPVEIEQRACARSPAGKYP